MRWAGIITEEEGNYWTVRTGQIGTDRISKRSSLVSVSWGDEVVIETYPVGNSVMWRIVQAKSPVNRAKSLAQIIDGEPVWPGWAGTTYWPVES